MTPPKFTTLGCRLNAYETEAMKEALRPQRGLRMPWWSTPAPVTAEAVRKARPGNSQAAPARIRMLTLIVTGCAAQTEPETFAEDG